MGDAPRAASAETPSGTPGEPADSAPSLPGGQERGRFADIARYVTFGRAAIVGVATGCLAVAFGWALHAAEHMRHGALERLHHHPAWGWAVLPLVAGVVGAVVCGCVKRYEPDASGSGIPHLKGVLLHLRELRPWRLIAAKLLGGCAAIGVGFSLGREGPTVQMGAAAGKIASRLLGVEARLMPQFISFGAGAGLSAAFHAPLAGFIFVIEELRREMSPLTYAGALIAAVSADIVSRTLTGSLPSFSIPAGTAPALPLLALPAVAAFGVASGAVGVLFNRCLMRGLTSTSRLRARNPWLLGGMVGVVVGLVAWWLPDAVGGGHAAAQSALTGGFSGTTMGALGLLVVAKLALTTLSTASGAPGGIFAPMLLLGSLSGLMVGRMVGWGFPDLGSPELSFAILGMAAWFVASVRAPLTGVVLILEMTGDYNQLFPLSVCCLMAYLTAEALRDKPIYESMLEEDLRYGETAKTGVGEASARTVVFGVHTGSRFDGRMIKEAGIPPGCWVVSVERRGVEIIATGGTVVRAGDHVTVVVDGASPEKALEIVRLCTAEKLG